MCVHARKQMYILVASTVLSIKLLMNAQIYIYIYIFFFFPVALRPNAGHDLLILEVSRSHTTTHHSR